MDQTPLRPVPGIKTLPPYLVTLVVFLAACTTTTSQLPGPSFGVGADNQRLVMGMVRVALRAEPAGIAPDTLFAIGATFVANGTDRVAAPRYAGIGRGGTLRVTALTGEVILPYAYAVASYQWDASDGSARELGRATFLLHHRNNKWRIRHVHSSMFLPWDRN
jgi:hypothetical protein